jgi:short-subunit dehydrogenase
MNLKNKTIIVTGASDGIGKEIALRLAKDKANVLILSRNEDKLKAVKKEIKDLGFSAEYYVCDLRKLEDIKSTVEKISENHDSIDGLINNAGVWQKLDNIENISDQEVMDVLHTNLSGLILLTKHTMPLLKKSKNAGIINISSKSGYTAQAGQSVYTASKYGVRGFTEVLQQDLKGSGIKVAGVYQAGTNTKMFEKAGEDWSDDKYRKFIPAEELAEVVAFMISRPEYIWLSEVRVESK